MTNNELKELNKNRNIYQICIVTKNIEKLMQDMITYLGIGPWRVLTLNNKSIGQLNADVNKGSANTDKPFEFYVAVCMVGDLQFELVQPVYGDTIYQKFIDSGREGLHHIKEKVDMKEWDSIKDRFNRKGIDVISSGWLGKSFFAYLDTEPTLGFSYEIGSCPETNRLPEECNLRCFPEE